MIHAQRLEPASHVDMDSLDLRVSLQTSLAKLTADTALLNTTKGNTGIAVLATVDPDHTGLDLLGDAVGRLQVLSEDSRAKTVGGVVGHGNSLLLSLEADNNDNRAEDLLTEDAHLRSDLSEDGRGDEETLAVSINGDGLATSSNSGALILTNLNVLEDTVVLDSGDLRTLEGVLTPLVANLANSVDGVDELLHELVVDTVLDKNTRGGSADLALVGEDTEVSPLGSLLNLSVVEDEERRLATSLKGDILKGLGGGAHDVGGGGSRASEGDLVDQRVRGEGSTGLGTEAVDNVDDTGRETSLLDQTTEDEDVERGLLGSLKNDGVTAGESRAELPGGHSQGVGPRDDLGNNTDGLAESVCELLARGADGLTVDLVGPARVVSESGGGLNQITLKGLLVGLACTKK